MDQVMRILKPNKFNMLMKEVKKFWKKGKTLDSENRILEHSVGILKDSNVSTYDCFLFLKFKERENKLGFLSGIKLAETCGERSWSGSIKATIIHKIFERNSSFHMEFRNTVKFIFYFSAVFC